MYVGNSLGSLGGELDCLSHVTDGLVIIPRLICFRLEPQLNSRMTCKIELHLSRRYFKVKNIHSAHTLRTHILCPLWNDCEAARLETLL
jgi:hypothetical protein